MSLIDTSNIPATKPRRFKVAIPRPKGPVGNPGSTAGQMYGLGPMARVTTAYGEYHAQTLRVGDRVLTKSGEFIPIKSIDRVTFDSDYLAYHPKVQPILIRAGALAQRVPTADVLLAPYQRIHASQTLARPAVATAVDALGGPHVCRKPETMITYTVLGFDRDAVIRCEGLWLDVESSKLAA
ncbi:MAG: hypothetical protein COB40_04220 [Marinosulfonomonas sp.]|nr:MAG: hypothetical protein COB40_04220 [Marinosulfonomonas sp.]